MKPLVIFFSFLLFVFTTHAQTENHSICGYQTEVQRLIQKNPNYLTWQNAWYSQALQEIQDLQNAKRAIIADTLYLEIPVVFHVLYNIPVENIHENYILSQLEELNLAFRKLTSDTQRIRSIFKPVAADVKINFVLATKDPQGNVSSGITRTSTNRTTFATNIWGAYSTFMKSSSSGGKTAWDPTSYLNIWICNMQYPGGYSIVYGFATPPTGAPNWDNTGNVTKDSTDPESGVVLHYKIVGKNNSQAPAKYNEGKTAVHEVGHYLGLRHVWGDGTNQTGCSLDDGIYDTPNSKLSNATCNGQNSCMDAVDDKPDQTENYMDYALDGCAAMFTKQQAFIMRFVVNNFRSGLPKRMIVYDTVPDPPYTSTSVDFYPNPVSQSGDVQLLIKHNIKAYFSVSIIDMSGKQVYQQDLQSNIKHNISCSGIACSTYYLIVRDSSGLIIGKQILLVL